MPRASFTLVILTSCLALGGCASAAGDYPSLAIRDAERASGSAMPVEAAPPPPPTPVSAQTGQRIAQALERARKAHAAFVAGTGGTTGAVSAARGSRAPADAWIAAQLALANLQSLRSQAVIAQADLDILFAEERLAEPGPISPTAQALADARQQVDGWVDEQNRTIARLAGQLGS